MPLASIVWSNLVLVSGLVVDRETSNVIIVLLGLDIDVAEETEAVDEDMPPLEGDAEDDASKMEEVD